ncbi:MAG: RNHCP domain-containing protein [Candidatus Protochlamydia sp.]|nr:RNHCP domain-containing protein [Candidatus Protochlamydia sp.]
MSKKDENVHFVCAICQQNVWPLQNGSYRNHCPFCLGSIHVDNKPGDRSSLCKGTMMACRLIYNGKKGWQVTHKCQKCGIEKVNKIADGYVQPDDWQILIRLSQQI